MSTNSYGGIQTSATHDLQTHFDDKDVQTIKEAAVFMDSYTLTHKKSFENFYNVAIDQSVSHVNTLTRYRPNYHNTPCGNSMPEKNKRHT